MNLLNNFCRWLGLLNERHADFDVDVDYTTKCLVNQTGQSMVTYISDGDVIAYAPMEDPTDVYYTQAGFNLLSPMYQRLMDEKFQVKPAIFVS